VEARALVLVISVAAACYGQRVIPMVAFAGRSLPSWLDSVLKLLPPAILGGLVAIIFWGMGQDGELSIGHAVATAATVVVARATRNLAAAVTAGLVSLYVMLQLLP